MNYQEFYTEYEPKYFFIKERKFNGGYYTYYNYGYIPNKTPVIIIEKGFLRKTQTVIYFPFKLNDGTYILL